MFNLCRPIMPSGAKCHAPALRGKPYCYFHTRLHKFTAAPPIEVDGNLRLGVLEDRSAIQIALAQVLDALYSGRLDPRRAGLSLYGIQIASQNVERNPLIIPIATVESITHTDAGDELGPKSASATLANAPHAPTATPAKTPKSTKKRKKRNQPCAQYPRFTAQHQPHTAHCAFVTIHSSLTTEN